MSTHPPPRPWGERSFFFEKSLGYAFSFELDLRGPPDRLFEGPAGLKIGLAAGGGGSRFFHVLGAETLTGPDGRELCPPVGTVLQVDQTLTLRDGVGSAETEGRLILGTEDGAVVAASYGGLTHLAPRPDAAAFAAGAELAGRSHLILTFETSQRSYRWLCERQYVAFGQLELGLPDAQQTRPLRATYDVYLTA